MILILMGVSGTGKTTVGQMLSSQIGWPFEDGDDFHSEANRLKMATGTPLTDEDRAPWLMTLHERIVRLTAQGCNEILACSALREIYRATLTEGLPEGSVQFVLLTAPPEVLEQHLLGRRHPFMNPNLLESQLQTLEWPQNAWEISVAGSPEESVASIENHLNATRPPRIRSGSGSEAPR